MERKMESIKGVKPLHMCKVALHCYSLRPLYTSLRASTRVFPHALSYYAH